MTALPYAEVAAATARVEGAVRPVQLLPVEPVGGAELWLAAEYMQHTGSFKARGALNFTAAHLADMPAAGVVIASGGNAGLACAWAARRHGITATVFVPRTAPPVKVAKLLAYGADVRQVGTEYAQAMAAAHEFADRTGALASHAYDHPLIAAGAGTLAEEIAGSPRLGPGGTTVVVAVGGGGLFAGVAAVAEHRGLRVVAVEPEHCRALNAALEQGRPVDVEVRSIAADSLGARRVSGMALAAAQRIGARSVLVDDSAIADARQALWDERRIAVEHAAATALAALLTGAYRPQQGERVVVVLCGANTDPADLVSRL
ncbi:serine/threonine dehydratase [Actinokineospora sp. NPDC004072]